MRVLLPSLCALAIAGCASDPQLPYREPKGGPTASVTFRNATPGRTTVAVYEDAAACTVRRQLPALLVGEERTVSVPAGQPLAFTVRYTVPNQTPPRYCEVTATFPPRPGGSYAVAVVPQGEKSCTVELAGAEAGMQVTLREAVKARTEAGPFCEPL
jgi:hypothetical protein